ncbi:MAG: thioredoxin domain-containing protein [Pirellulales bacterium]
MAAMPMVRWRRLLPVLAVAATGAVAATTSCAQDAPVRPAPTDPPPVNRLAKEASPYLRQHQHNPVDWYPWGDEAFARAKKDDRPIFLSIGYSACHWCHVMAAESFADPAIARLLNANYVCIKVDREERPDVDEIYMAAVQAMGQSGGWPLSVWLTPDGRPFYGGTYFPPVDAPGRPGFRRVLEQLTKAWQERRQEVLTGAGELTKHLAEALAPALAPGEPTAALLVPVLAQSQERFDAQHGGFAAPPLYAPKFPSPVELQVLLRLPGDDALPLVVTTLRAMHRGGIYDQLGGGFHRYATDRAWRVPHFEKMLYDNALLAPCYVDAFARTGDAEFAAVARETLDYLLRELGAPAGGFWSSQDAQSEGVEGKFFAWTRGEVVAVLGDDDGARACAWFGVTADGHWEHTNVLSLPAGPVAGDAAAAFASARARLFAARARRVPPATDDKVLAAWNGMALRALAAGYRGLADERYRAAARQTAAFVVRELVRDGRVARAWHGGTARHAGCLEDYGALADGLLAVFEIDGDARWLAAARGLLAAIVARFGAPDGGFWFTADDHESLVARTKVAYEGSTPSGTALAVQALLRGGLLLGDEALYARGVAALRANHALLATQPAAAPALVAALQFHLGDPREVVIAGEPDDPRTQALLRAAWRSLAAQVVACVHDGNREALGKASPVFAGKVPVAGAPAAYVCRRGVCLAPITDPRQLAEAR